VLDAALDRRLRRALTVLVRAVGSHDDRPGVGIDGLDSQVPRIGGARRTELHREGASIRAVVIGTRDLRARQARGDGLDVDQRGPHLLDGRGDFERLLQSHPAPPTMRA
jgi:hypothetical protein